MAEEPFLPVSIEREVKPSRKEMMNTQHCRPYSRRFLRFQDVVDSSQGDGEMNSFNRGVKCLHGVCWIWIFESYGVSVLRK